MAMRFISIIMVSFVMVVLAAEVSADMADTLENALKDSPDYKKLESKINKMNKELPSHSDQSANKMIVKLKELENSREFKKLNAKSQDLAARI